MATRFLLLITMVTAVSHAVNADPESWMVRDDPLTLGFQAIRDRECPRFDIDEIVEDVFVKAGVTPVRATRTRDLYLVVYIRCGGVPFLRDFFLFDLDTNFRTMKYGPELFYPRDHLRPPTDLVNASDVELAVREDVSAAINDYVEAQMLYGPSDQ